MLASPALYLQLTVFAKAASPGEHHTAKAQAPSHASCGSTSSLTLTPRDRSNGSCGTAWGGVQTTKRRVNLASFLTAICPTVASWMTTFQSRQLGSTDSPTLKMRCTVCVWWALVTLPPMTHTWSDCGRCGSMHAREVSKSDHVCSESLILTGTQPVNGM